MLERADQNLVARSQPRTGPGLRHQINAFGRAPHEDDLARAAGVDEAPHALAGPLVGGRGRLAERMHAAMHIGVRMCLVLLDRAQHRARALCGCRAVRSEEHTSELQSLRHLVCRLLLEKKKKTKIKS